MIYAPIPDPDRDIGDHASQKLYASYLAQSTHQPFIVFCRSFRYDGNAVKPRGRRGRHATKTTVAVGVRFPFELLDNYVGQWAAMFLPHGSKAALWERTPILKHTRCLLGVLKYLMDLNYRDDDKAEILADAVQDTGGPMGWGGAFRPVP